MSGLTDDEPMIIPTESELTMWIDGAWERKGRRLGRGPFDEPAVVTRLTVVPYFCDLRVLARNDRHPNALDLSQAFGGGVSVSENVVTRSHDLDTALRATGHSDSASIVGHPSELLEVGLDYEERWVRAFPPSGPVGVAQITDHAESLFARMVLVGSMAIAVWAGPTPGGALLERTDRWTLTRSVGDGHLGMDLCGVAGEIADRGHLPRGWRRVA